MSDFKENHNRDNARLLPSISSLSSPRLHHHHWFLPYQTISNPCRNEHKQWIFQCSTESHSPRKLRKNSTSIFFCHTCLQGCISILKRSIKCLLNAQKINLVVNCIPKPIKRTQNKTRLFRLHFSFQYI